MATSAIVVAVVVVLVVSAFWGSRDLAAAVAMVAHPCFAQSYP